MSGRQAYLWLGIFGALIVWSISLLLHAKDTGGAATLVVFNLLVMTAGVLTLLMRFETLSVIRIFSRKVHSNDSVGLPFIESIINAWPVLRAPDAVIIHVAMHSRVGSLPLQDNKMVGNLRARLSVSTPPEALDLIQTCHFMRLRSIIEGEKAHRDKGQPISGPAERFQTPGYFSRRPINRQLGHEYFYVFLNITRVLDAESPMRGPWLAHCPTQTNPDNVGFGLSATFNRPIKEQVSLPRVEFLPVASVKSASP